MGLSRDEVFITNVLKSRPPGNRDPQPDEIEACRPYLDRQIELIEPRVICTLGNFATKLLTRSSRGITGVRGRPQVHEIGARTVRVYPLYHPAAALRTHARARGAPGGLRGPARRCWPSRLRCRSARWGRWRPPPAPEPRPQLDLFG